MLSAQRFKGSSVCFPRAGVTNTTAFTWVLEIIQVLGICSLPNCTIFPAPAYSLCFLFPRVLLCPFLAYKVITENSFLLTPVTGDNLYWTLASRTLVISCSMSVVYKSPWRLQKLPLRSFCFPLCLMQTKQCMFEWQRTGAGAQYWNTCQVWKALFSL